MRTQPGAQQRPEAFHRIDMDLVEPDAILVAGVLAVAVAHRLVSVAPTRAGEHRYHSCPYRRSYRVWWRPGSTA